MKPSLPVAGLCLLALLPFDAARASECIDGSTDCAIEARDAEALPEDAVVVEFASGKDVQMPPAEVDEENEEDEDAPDDDAEASAIPR
jgi:hypothetical protein